MRVWPRRLSNDCGRVAFCLRFLRPKNRRISVDDSVRHKAGDRPNHVLACVFECGVECVFCDHFCGCLKPTGWGAAMYRGGMDKAVSARSRQPGFNIPLYLER